MTEQAKPTEIRKCDPEDHDMQPEAAGEDGGIILRCAVCGHEQIEEIAW